MSKAILTQDLGQWWSDLNCRLVEDEFNPNGAYQK
jgi:hypothetical protein